MAQTKTFSEIAAIFFFGRGNGSSDSIYGLTGNDVRIHSDRRGLKISRDASANFAIKPKRFRRKIFTLISEEWSGRRLTKSLKLNNMPRNMSFALTQKQIKNRTKTVTRRTGWKFLKVGDELNAVNKTMGFKKGEKPEYLARIRVVGVREEPLKAIDSADVIAEGFGDDPTILGMPSCFITFFRSINPKITPDTIVTRIEFEYLN